ncbi:MAG: hypothetical protein EBS78_11900, partial [Altererythrobacter sp.]|nr:hypothetical protein [Altererythrobacter sp.]
QAVQEMLTVDPDKVILPESAVDGLSAPQISVMKETVAAVQTSFAVAGAALRSAAAELYHLKGVIAKRQWTKFLDSNALPVSKKQAQDLVRAMRYPPEGIRGSGAALARASMFSLHTEYVQTANAQMCLLVQVETKKGIENLDAINAVEGVDGVFIGPSDLAADMGYPGNSNADAVQACIKDALARIAAAGKSPGILATDDATVAKYRNWGARFIAVGIDVLMLAQAARAKARHWKGQ